MIIAGYEIDDKIAAGGMATVYRGRQISLQRPVAIKVLSQSLIDEPIAKAHFHQESLLIARLNHPNIIHVIDQGLFDDDRPFFVMEYVHGVPLDTAVEKGIPMRRKVDFCVQICKALSYAHRNGVIHRDIKPGNILVDYEANVKILDFGIAAICDEGKRDEDMPDTSKTVMGTYNYMAPEQRQSAEATTERSDLYSLGVVMYELFTGMLPTEGYPPPKQLNEDIPEPLSYLILDCLETDPEQRPASADDVKNRLLVLLRGAHIGAEQKSRANQGVKAMKQDFELLDVLKEDEYGAAFLFQQTKTGSWIVIKKRLGDSSGYEENRGLTKVKHPHIVKILGASRNERIFITVMEFMGAGNLLDRMSQALELKDFLEFGLQIATGMEEAHKWDIVHGNLRPTNILFASERVLKIADFGFREHYADSEDASNWYQAPERERSIEGDIYSVGVIFFQMLSGQTPEQAAAGGFDTATLGVPDKLAELIDRMMSPSPANRVRHFGRVVSVLREVLREADTAIEEPEELPPPPPPPPPPPVWPKVLGAIILVAAASAATILIAG